MVTTRTHTLQSFRQAGKLLDTIFQPSGLNRALSLNEIKSTGHGEIFNTNTRYGMAHGSKLLCNMITDRLYSTDMAVSVGHGNRALLERPLHSLDGHQIVVFCQAPRPSSDLIHPDGEVRVGGGRVEMVR